MLSTKYKHGDVVALPDKTDKIAIEFGTVVEISKLILGKDKERYRQCMFGMRLFQKKMMLL